MTTTVTVTVTVTVTATVRVTVTVTATVKVTVTVTGTVTVAATVVTIAMIMTIPEGRKSISCTVTVSSQQTEWSCLSNNLASTVHALDTSLSGHKQIKIRI